MTETTSGARTGRRTRARGAPGRPPTCAVLLSGVALAWAALPPSGAHAVPAAQSGEEVRQAQDAQGPQDAHAQVVQAQVVQPQVVQAQVAQAKGAQAEGAQAEGAQGRDEQGQGAHDPGASDLRAKGDLTPPPAWVLLGPAGRLKVRTLAGAVCPRARVDGRLRRLSVRAAPSVLPLRPTLAGPAYVKAADFPLSVCELDLARGTRRVSLYARPLPLPPRRVRRIVVIGDTGCRIKASDNAAQDCNSASAYPFARIAASAARLRPDLVIHVGDYDYRETPCPGADAGCKGSPWGYGLDVWRADFLDPAAPLLRAAVLAAARGNHESCTRAGQGWWRLLDPHPLIEGRDCVRAEDDEIGDHSPPWAASLGGGDQLLVFDSAASTKAMPARGSAAFARLDQDRRALDILARGSRRSILVDHHPLLGFASAVAAKGRPAQMSGGQESLQAVFTANGRSLVPDRVAVTLAGHVHAFEQVSFKGAYPTQIVAGFSGTQEDVGPLDEAAVAGHAPMAGAVVNAFAGMTGRFGFLTMDREGAGRWRIAVRDQDGVVLRVCRLTGRQSRCDAQKTPEP